MNVNAQLKAQNDLSGWLDCTAKGGRHKWQWRKVQRVGDWAYEPCARCPVSRRRRWIV